MGPTDRPHTTLGGHTFDALPHWDCLKCGTSEVVLPSEVVKVLEALEGPRELTRVLVSGSREGISRQTVHRALDAALTHGGALGQSPYLLIHGCAKGVDTYADEWAEENGVAQKRCPVHSVSWETYGKAAGPMRNQAMVDFAAQCTRGGILIAFPGNPGRGTRGTIEMALKSLESVFVADHKVLRRIK